MESTHVIIQPTQFTTGKEATKYGVRVISNQGSFFDDSWESIPDTDFDILEETCASANESIEIALLSVLARKEGLFIGETWYDWYEISHILEEHFGAVKDVE